MLGTRLKVMLAAFSVMMVIGGFASLGEGMKYPWAKKITYDQFIKQGPVEGWYEVHGGYLDITGAILPGKEAKGYLVPFRAVGEPAATPVRALVEVSDDSLVQQIDRYNNSVGKDTTVWGMSHDAQTGAIPPTAITMDISGMVRNYGVSTGDESDSATASSLETANMLTIHKDKHPSIILGIGSIVAGLMMCMFSLTTFGIHLDFRGLREGRNAGRTANNPSPTYGQPTYAPVPPPYQAYGQSPPVPPPLPIQAPPATPYPLPSLSTGQYQPPPAAPYQLQPPPIPSAPAPAAVIEPPTAPEPDRETREKSKEQAEMDKLRELKPFDPFANS